MTGLPSDNPQSEIRNPQSPITDSPWFWVFLFCAFALVMVAIYGHNARDRQAMLERRYQARDRVMHNEPVVDQFDEPIAEAEGSARRRFATRDKPLIPIWPLIALLTSAIAFAAYKLRQQRKRYDSIGPGY
jgi:hypothetical protein